MVDYSGNSIVARQQRRFKQLDIQCLAAIQRQLNEYRFNKNFRGTGKRVPWRQFAELCGVSRQTLYALSFGDRKGIEPATRDRILAAFKLVDAGLRWKRTTVRKAIVERIVHAPAIIEWQAVMPDGKPPPPIPRRHISAKRLADHERRRAAAAAARADESMRGARR